MMIYAISLLLLWSAVEVGQSTPSDPKPEPSGLRTIDALGRSWLSNERPSLAAIHRDLSAAPLASPSPPPEQPFFSIRGSLAPSGLK